MYNEENSVWVLEKLKTLQLTGNTHYSVDLKATDGNAQLEVKDIKVRGLRLRKDERFRIIVSDKQTRDPVEWFRVLVAPAAINEAKERNRIFGESVWVDFKGVNNTCVARIPACRFPHNLDPSKEFWICVLVNDLPNDDEDSV